MCWPCVEEEVNFKKIKSLSKKKKEKEKRNGLKIWWIATFPPNLAWIGLSFSEKSTFTDHDEEEGDGRSRHGISSADTVKHS